MSKKLIIVLSAKKSGGKSCGSKFILCEYLNRKIGKKRFIIEEQGKEFNIIDIFNNNKVLYLDRPSEESKQIADKYSAKIYSFADPLKKICIDLLGLDVIQCYGSDDDKNSSTHILWDGLSEDIKVKYTKVRRGTGGKKPAVGGMCPREVLEVLGTDMIRALDENAFARGTYNLIDQENYDLSIIQDCRFPNEVTMGTEVGAKVIRLLRNPYNSETKPETALDNFPLGEFTFVLDNKKMSIEQTQNAIRPMVLGWFKSYGL